MPQDLQAVIDTLQSVEDTLTACERGADTSLRKLRERTAQAEPKLQAIKSELEALKQDFDGVQAMATTVEEIGASLAKARTQLDAVDPQLALQFDERMAGITATLKRVGSSFKGSAATITLSCQNLGFQAQYLATASDKLTESSTFTRKDVHDRVELLVKAIRKKRWALRDEAALPLDDGA